MLGELTSLPEAPLASTRFRTIIFGLLALILTANLLGTALSPWLLVKRPLLLVALSPVSQHVALAAASVDAVPLITVGTLRRMLSGVAAYGLGVLYGATAVAWVEQRYPRLAKLVRFLERLFARWGAALLVLWPAPTLCVLAGAAGTRLYLFLLTSTLGTALGVGVTYYIGDLISAWSARLIAFLSAHLVESTLVCIAAVVLQQLIARRSRARRAKLPEDGASVVE